MNGVLRTALARRLLGRSASRDRRTSSRPGVEAMETRWMLSTTAVQAPAHALSAEVAPVGDGAAAQATVTAERHHRHRHRHGGGAPAVMDASVGGSWTPATAFKPPGANGAYVAIHMAVLPNGQVLAWPHDYNYFTKNRHAAPYTPDIMLWDPATNQYQKLPTLNTNIFCSGTTFTPSGDLMILGGHGPSAVPTSALQTHYGNKHAVIYDYKTNTWQDSPDMARGRYYGSAITLNDGSVLAVAGYSENGGNNPLIEKFQNGQWRSLTGATTQAWPDWYPHIYQLDNGLVFGSNPGQRTFFLDPTGSGRIWEGPVMNYKRRYDGATAMYAPDQILVLGGTAAKGSPPVSHLSRNITSTAETINLDAPDPSWRYTGSMHHARLFPNATLLPDDTVLVTGGTSSTNNLKGAVYAGEIWDPKTGQWSEMNSMSVPRLYHSTAILLPDARVLVAGGGEPESTGEAKGTTHQNMQIFSPPYLSRGPQPVIATAPSSANYGDTISVTSPDSASITTIRLIRNGATTHGFNMTQRIVDVPFDRAADGTLQLHLPSNPNAAPPGPYMLFLLNDKGIPSKASMLNLGGTGSN